MIVSAFVSVDLPDTMEEDPLFVLASLLHDALENVKVLRVDVTPIEQMRLVPTRIAAIGEQMAEMMDGAEQRRDEPAQPDPLERLRQMRDELQGSAKTVGKPMRPDPGMPRRKEKK